MNEANLNAEQRSRLWHWRLGHPSHASHYYMNKRGNVKYQGPCKCLTCNEDCVVCDKSSMQLAQLNQEHRKEHSTFYLMMMQKMEGLIQLDADGIY